MSTAIAVSADGQDRQLEALRRIATQATPKGEIRVRVGRGGAQLKYTDGAYVIRTLNEAFGWDWDFVADHEELLMNGDKPFEVKVRGTLTVRLNGQAVTKTQFGSQPIEMLKNGSAPVSIGDCYKGAATDAMKKCASLLGVALDLYDSDYRADKYADERQLEPPINTGAVVYPAHEMPPEKPQFSKGAQPSPTAPRREPTSVNGKEIFRLIRALKWGAEKVCAWMEGHFSYAIETDDFGGFFDSLQNAEQQKIIAALKAEFNNR